MSDPDDSNESKELELRLDIMQIVAVAGHRAVGRTILRCLNDCDTSTMIKELHWLIDEGFLRAGRHWFSLTSKGVGFMIESKRWPSYMRKFPFETDADAGGQ